MAEGDETILARLNEVADLLGAAKAGTLRDLLGQSRGTRGGSCSVDCDCNLSFCSCRGEVNSFARIDQISHAEFIARRQELLRELKAQMERLAIPGK